MISKRSQLVLSVIIFLIVIIFLWVYLNSKTNLLNFGLGQETQNFGKNISTQIKDLNFRKDFNTKVNELKNNIVTDYKTQEDLLKQKIAQKMIENISTTTVVQTKEYFNKDWNISFNYNNEMTISENSKTQTLEVKKNDDESIFINRKSFKEQSFDAWLVKNFNLKDLNKIVINNNVFWEKESSKLDVDSKSYYISSGKYVFTISADCKKNDNTCQSDINIILSSFKIT